MQRRSFLGAISCLPALALSATASPAVPQHSAKGTPASRRRVGIALGGGSIHGIAHLGVLKAFAEKGLQLQFIAGTSAGAIVGVLAAAQLPVLRKNTQQQSLIPQSLHAVRRIGE